MNKILKKLKGIMYQSIGILYAIFIMGLIFTGNKAFGLVMLAVIACVTLTCYDT